MPVHLYGVLDVEAKPSPSMRGLDGLPVRTIRSARDAPGCPTFPDRRSMRLRSGFASTMRCCATRSSAEYSVVPSLFGRLHANDTSLGASLEQSAEALDEAMVRVRGRVEMSFLVAASGVPAAAEREELGETREPGREHLRRLRSRIHAERILRDKAAEQRNLPHAYSTSYLLLSERWRVPRLRYWSLARIWLRVRILRVMYER